MAKYPTSKARQINKYEVIRSAYCVRHNKNTSNFIGVTRTDDGDRLWIFECPGMGNRHTFLAYEAEQVTDGTG